MDLQNFYNQYGLGVDMLANIANVSTKTIRKYERGEPIQSRSKEKIEMALRAIHKHCLVGPNIRWDYVGSRASTSYWTERRKYCSTVKLFIEREMGL